MRTHNNTNTPQKRGKPSSAAAASAPLLSSVVQHKTTTSREKKGNRDPQPPPPSPLRRLAYFSRSRQQSSALSSSHNLMMSTPEDFIGIYSPWAVLWGLIFVTVPVCYVYVGLVLMREICLRFPQTIHQPINIYLPYLATLINWMHHRSYRVLEYWCWIEGIFYLALRLHTQWLQMKDPLEASLSAAPLMEIHQRQILWQRMVECESDDPAGWLRGWFFDIETIEVISKYDIRDFLTWCMFEGRHQEHLTTSEVATRPSELNQLEGFVDDLEYRISLQLYGSADEDDDEVVEIHDDGLNDSLEATTATTCSGEEEEKVQQVIDPLSTPRPPSRRDALSQLPVTRDDGLPTPKKMFRFREEMNADEPSHFFFFDLYESYKNRYEQVMKNAPDINFHPVQDLKEMVKSAAPTDFHPVQDLKKLVAETSKTISHAEESAYATASQMYTTIIPSGSQMDKHLSAMSHATSQQLTDAWNSMKNMKDRLETARFLTKQRQRIRQQLKGYRVMLNRMREMSSAVSAKQMAAMMRRITECNQSLELLEDRAQNAFVKATGFARNNLPAFLQHQDKEPQHYARYSSDPLLGTATYPLGFHLLILGCTEIPLRIMLHRRGFERRTIGSVAYYVHPGREEGEEGASNADGKGDNANYEEDEEIESTMTPIVFVHGIGIGLIAYIPLIDKLLETGRPILLPEIPYVSAFRPLQSPSAVLSPATVASTMTAMLATHGHLTGTWVGHSYGTSWLSYMVQFAPNAVSSIVFLDPICFCLHVPRLTKQFVYQRPDPGTASYIVRTDIIVNWTIQRSFPWTSIILFAEQVQVPCAIFLSDKDALVPAPKVEDYLRKKGAPVCDFDKVKGSETFFESPSSTNIQTGTHPLFSVTVFRDAGHGDWVEHPRDTVPTIASAVETLCRRAEQRKDTRARLNSSATSTSVTSGLIEE